MRAPFGLSNADELEALVRAAGFQNVAIQQRSETVRFPSVERFVLSYVAGSPLAGPVSKVDEAARAALITDVRNALGKYTSNRVSLSHSRPSAERKSVGRRVRSFAPGTGSLISYACRPVMHVCARKLNMNCDFRYC